MRLFDSVGLNELLVCRSKHIKGSKERYLLGQIIIIIIIDNFCIALFSGVPKLTICKFLGVIPFIKLQNDT